MDLFGFIKGRGRKIVLFLFDTFCFAACNFLYYVFSDYSNYRSSASAANISRNCRNPVYLYFRTAPDLSSVCECMALYKYLCKSEYCMCRRTRLHTCLRNIHYFRDKRRLLASAHCLDGKPFACADLAFLLPHSFQEAQCHTTRRSVAAQCRHRRSGSHRNNTG